MTLSKSKVFLILCLAFILGVFLGQYLNYEIMAVCAMIFVIAGTVWWGNKTVFILSIAGVVMLLGSLRFQQDYSRNDLAPFYGQEVILSGIVSEEPDERSDKTLLTLSGLEIGSAHLHSKLLATVNRFPAYHYGEKLNLEAKLAEPKEFDDFNYKNYLSRFGIDAVTNHPKVSVVPGTYGNPVKRIILGLKGKFVGNLSKVLPEPQNAFLGGLLLGTRRAIPQELVEKFNITGTSHVIAVSGYNITIIAAGVESLLAWLGLRKKLSFGISLLAIGIFVIMTGASASVIRAGIMGALLLVALNIGRVYAVSNALAITAVIMLLINPQILAFDVGFQLSFAALLGLVYLTPLLEAYFRWVPQFAREFVLATIAAQIFTLPILLLNFGLLSLAAVPANILVLIAVPITMLFGFLTAAAAFVWLKLALPLAAVTWLLLTYLIKVVEYISRIPYASLSIKFNVYELLAYYFLLFTFYIWIIRRKKFANI